VSDYEKGIEAAQAKMFELTYGDVDLCYLEDHLNQAIDAFLACQVEVWWCTVHGHTIPIGASRCAQGYLDEDAWFMSEGAGEPPLDCVEVKALVIP
jgi:hypothetical protein